MQYSSVIIDWKQTLYDPESDGLIDGAIELLQELKPFEIPMFLVGKGDQDMYTTVANLGVREFFEGVLFVGTEKLEEHFTPHIDINNPQSTLVIGDKPDSEIELGNRLGVTTIRVKQGKFAQEQPANDLQKPDYVVDDLFGVAALVKNLFAEQNQNNPQRPLHARGTTEYIFTSN